MRINHPLILKGLFGSLKILYFIVIKRNTAVISPINHHNFYGRAILIKKEKIFASIIKNQFI